MHAELTPAVVLSIDSQLPGSLYAPVKTTFLFEIDTLEPFKLLPDGENKVAVFETAYGKGGGKMGKAELSGFACRLAEVVGKALLTSCATFTLPLRALDKREPALVVIQLGDHLKLIHFGNLQQGLIPPLGFFLRENVAVREVQDRIPPLIEQTLDAGGTAGTATGMYENITCFHADTIRQTKPLLQPPSNPCRVQLYRGGRYA